MNKKARVRRLCSLCVCAALVLLMPSQAKASSSVIGLVPDERNLFLQMSDMMPGESYADTFTVVNLGADNYTFYLQAESAAEHDFDGGADGMESCERLLQELEMKVVVHRGNSVEEYSGKANQVDCHDDYVAMIGRRIELGALAPGESVQIEATVTVPAELDNAHSGVQGKFWWNFSAETAEGDPVDTTQPNQPPKTFWQRLTAPQTGDGNQLLLWALLLAVSTAALMLGMHYTKKSGPAH